MAMAYMIVCGSNISIVLLTDMGQAMIIWT